MVISRYAPGWNAELKTWTEVLKNKLVHGQATSPTGGRQESIACRKVPETGTFVWADALSRIWNDHPCSQQPE